MNLRSLANSQMSEDIHTQRTRSRTPNGHTPALTQTDAPHALARDYLHAIKQHKSRGAPSRLSLDAPAQSPVQRSCWGQAGRVGAIRVACGRGGARLAKGVQAKGGAHLPVNDADVVLDATRIQGVRRPSGAGLTTPEAQQRASVELTVS